MLSLDNTYGEDDLREFHERVLRGLDGESVTYSIEPKIDGFGIELTYKQGVLVLGATRGDGRIGEDVTANVRDRAAASRCKLREPVDIVVRGEIYMTKAEFAAINAERVEARRGAVQEPAQHRGRHDQADGSARGREAADAHDPLRGRRRRRATRAATSRRSTTSAGSACRSRRTTHRRATGTR